MSLHRPEKRLAVLVAVLEQGMSIREAGVTHNVAKESVSKWLREHRRGSETVESLRKQNVVPTAPLGSPAMAHGPLRSAPKALYDPVIEVKEMRHRRERFRDQLLKERVVVAERLRAIDEALASLEERI